ncbi:MAG: cobalamin ABC transporter substrate-binding protein [Myxococcales bacterium]|jgi:hypothetical protein|nr:cobalamin ABC transporter substrate-binding protein [Myxococcales bacterium]
MRRFLPVLMTLALAAFACNDKPPQAPQKPLPTYSGRQTELFDDGVEPAAVGLDMDKSYHPRSDSLLRERTETADAVIRVRLSTVTGKAEDTGNTYDIGMRTIEKLAGDRPPGETFTVRVDKGSPSVGIFKSFEGRLVGKEFIAFVRTFVRPDGDKEIHFHLAPDTKDVRIAVTDAVTLGTLK